MAPFWGTCCSNGRKSIRPSVCQRQGNFRRCPSRSSASRPHLLPSPPFPVALGYPGSSMGIPEAAAVMGLCSPKSCCCSRCHRSCHRCHSSRCYTRCHKCRLQSDFACIVRSKNTCIHYSSRRKSSHHPYDRSPKDIAYYNWWRSNDSKFRLLPWRVAPCWSMLHIPFCPHGTLHDDACTLKDTALAEWKPRPSRTSTTCVASIMPGSEGRQSVPRLRGIHIS